MPRPEFGHLQSAGVGANVGILARNENTLIINVMLAGWDKNDFAYGNGPSIQGTSAGQAVFPAGALLGCPETTATSWQKANRASVTAPVSPATKLYYSFSLVNILHRGRGANDATIPSSFNSHAVVLAKDVDISDDGDGNLITAGNEVDIFVPVYWQGTFKAHGIQQDAEGFASGAFSSVDCGGRISIVPTLD